MKKSYRCGCSVILPRRGKSDQFSIWSGHGFRCRIREILQRSTRHAERLGYKPINPDTPHTIIREMMQENCVLCGERLKWEFGPGKTPHLHHDHDTGEAVGFTHNRCNPNALENRVKKLAIELEVCRKQQPLLKAA